MNISEKELNNGKEQLSTIARRVIAELEYPEADEVKYDLNSNDFNIFLELFSKRDYIFYFNRH